MKLFITSALAIAAAAPVVASAQDNAMVTLERLERVVDSEYGEYYDFVYEDDSDRVKEINEFFTMRTRIGYGYDDKGLCTREALYQEIDGKYYEVCYYDYIYDDNGRISKVALYNNLKPTLPDSKAELSITEYRVYNDKGQLESTETYWDEAKLVPYAKQQFVYNEDGSMAEETETQYDMATSFVVYINHKIYTYNEQGKVQTVCVETPESDTSLNLAVSGWINYVYSADGNLQERYRTSGRTNNPEYKVERAVFMVDESVPASSVIYPKTPQPYRESDDYALLVNQLVALDDYKADDDTGLAGAIPFFSWEYYYDVIQRPAGVEEIVTNTFGSRLAGATVDGGVLRLHGVTGVNDLRIVDLNGRVVKTAASAGNKINVADLASGVYVLSTSAGNAKFVR